MVCEGMYRQGKRMNSTKSPAVSMWEKPMGDIGKFNLNIITEEVISLMEKTVECKQTCLTCELKEMHKTNFKPLVESFIQITGKF